MNREALNREAVNREGLAGRRVAVTGGTAGIGRGIARVLVRAGARAAICGKEDPGEALEELRGLGGEAGGEVWGTRCDLARPDAAGRFVDGAAAALGGLDAVVANAGRPAGGLCDMEEADWRDAVAVNLTAVLATCYHGARHLPEGGDAVVIGSMSAHRPGRGSSVYVAANGGLRVFAEAFRQEMSERRVHVALIEPGKTASSLFGEVYSADEMDAHVAAGRMLSAEDIGRAVAFALTAPPGCVVSGLRVEPCLHV